MVILTTLLFAGDFYASIYRPYEELDDDTLISYNIEWLPISSQIEKIYEEIYGTPSPLQVRCRFADENVQILYTLIY